MGYYFCSRIFLCFMCVITSPIFSAGMPNSNKKTNNNESNQNHGPAKDLEIDSSNSSDENDELSKSLVREILKVSNEELYPLTFYGTQLIFVNFEEHADENDEISILKVKEIIKESKATNFERIILNLDLNDAVMINLLRVVKIIFNEMIIHEGAFYEQLRKEDKNNNGTVCVEYAKDIILNCELFNGKLKGDRYKWLLGKYTNDQNQFKYEEMKNNVLDDIEADKSKIYSYNYKKKKWVRKYKFTSTHCL
ncbi:uncharacterized protein LOC126895000 [Daktulosphaira vitifoliae]|uniref:uncharacterized protein LOC126895000 n=1 Tax=Daktulosphaira vitifoliae TaxID=58002 RepID=UPI0021A98A5A|nr:uncharacterized protein LOC126895000 [Daktulosphaira vitifoliae]